jgi:hypothetical protein
MKEICENIFCFWRKWCNKSNTKEVSIESTKMIPKSKEQQELYTNLFSPSPVNKEKNVFKFSEAEMSTALTIEEIIFPLKYLNLAETNPSFHFTFTREKIMSFIEDEIKNKNSYTSLINNNGFDIYIKESGSIFNSEFPMIKMYYKIPKSAFNKKDINVKTIDKYMNEPEKRLKWDNSIREYKIVERVNSEVYLLHYICKSPMLFVSERDVVEKRYDFYEGGTYYDFSSSVKDDLIPLEDDVMRITDHCSACKIYEEDDCFNIISITQVDTKYKLPNALMSVQLPVKYKEWYDSLINAINEENNEN